MDIIIALIIHLLIPLAGLLYFNKIRKEMNADKIQNAPIIELFIAFATYGGVLLVVLTALFWKWSGLASLGTFYLILVAPFTMGIIAYRLRKNSKKTKYHKRTYQSGLLYFAIAPTVFVTLYIMIDHLEN